MFQDEPTNSGSAGSNSTYYDAILEYETRMDQNLPVEIEEIVRRYPSEEARLREYFYQRRQASNILLQAPGRRAPEFIDIQSFGFYSVLELMDWGGNASIHKVEDVRFGRTAALKIPLKKWATDADALRRLQREARLSGRLQHPNIVPIYDVGTTSTEQGELPYFTMRLVVGRPLSELLTARSSPAEDQFRYLLLFRQVSQAVAYAHEQGILHRDLKPNNVMVGDFDDAYVMDWGYAKDLNVINKNTGGVRQQSLDEFLVGLAGSTDDLAKTVIYQCATDCNDLDDKLILGTPCYLPPEIAKRGAGNSVRQSDVFCLGGVLCFILTGEPTYRGHELLEISRLAYMGDLRETYERLDNSGAAPELIALAKQCLSPNPTDRPEDARQVSLRVSEYIHRQEQAKLEAERQSALEARERAEAEALSRANAEARYVAERHSRRLTVALAAAVLVFVCLGGAVYWNSVEAARLARQSETHHEIQRCLELANATRRSTDSLDLNSLEDLDRVLIQWDRYLGLVDQAVSAMKGSERSADHEAQINAARALGRSRHDEIQHWRELLADIESAADCSAVAIDEYAPSRELADAAFAAAFTRRGIPSPFEQKAVVTALSTLPAGIRQTISAAIDRCANHETQKAIERFDLATAILASPPAWRMALRRLNESENVESLRQLIADSELHSEALTSTFYVNCINALRRWTTIEEALAVSERARNRFLNDYALHLQAAELHWSMTPRQQDRAEDSLRAALAISPQSPTALASLGFVLRKKGNFNQAKAVLKEAIRLQPDYPWALTNLGIIQATVDGDVLAAEEQYRKALEIFPQYPLAADGLVLVYSQTGRFDEALGLHKSLGIDPSTSTFRSFSLIFKHCSTGQFSLAEKDLDEFLRSPLAYGPERDVLIMLKSLIGGDLEHAEKVGQQIIIAKQTRFNMIFARALLPLIHVLDGRVKMAERELDDLVTEAPEFYVADVLRAVVSLYQGDVARFREKLATVEQANWMTTSSAMGVVRVTLRGYMSVLNLFLGPADEILKEPTLLGAGNALAARLQGTYAMPTAEVALLRGRGGLAYLIYAAMITRFPGSMLAGGNALINFWRHPTHRMNGVRAVGLLASGRATDLAEFDASQGPPIHKQGQEWLRAELKSWGRVSRTPDGRIRTRYWVHFCKKCPDLAGIRDQQFLEKLADDDRRGWEQIWQDINLLGERLSNPGGVAPSEH